MEQERNISTVKKAEFLLELLLFSLKLDLIENNSNYSMHGTEYTLSTTANSSLFWGEKNKNAKYSQSF